MISRQHTVSTPLRGARSARLVSAPLRWRLGQPALPYVTPRNPRVKQPTINASAGNSADPTEQQPHPGSASARQLLSVTALAFFSFVAILAKDRVTNPIVPPLIPPVPSLTSAPTPSSAIQPCSAATATAERPDVEPADTPRAPVKRPRSLLRTLWGTATLPVKLVDALLFPEEPLVGSAPIKQAPSVHSTTAEPAPAQQLATASKDGLSATLPAADPAAAAAGEALSAVAQQIDALAAATAAAVELPAAQASTSTAPGDFLLQLQDAVRRLAKQQQDAASSSSTAQAADSGASTAAAAVDTAAALAALRVLLSPDAMSLLPVVLVTAATAAAGLLLAASIAGVAGLVDRRRAATPAQRAAEAALFDSPLRPISCPTWPGFLPMLPSSIEPTFYRMRDATPSAAADDPVADDEGAAGVCSNSSEPQAAPGTVQTASSSAASQVATAATALAMLGVFVAPGAAGLLPVVLVTSGSAAAGLLLAASIAGVAGLVDKRRVLTPAQRAAEAALLDNPLRPISCPTMPGILPSLPASMEPIFYRWRESEPAARSADSSADRKADSTLTDTGSSTSTSTPDEASSTDSMAASPAKEHPLDQEWWSFAQIQALRLMPLLSQGSSSGKAGAGAGAGSVISKAQVADSTPPAQVTVQGAAAEPQAAAPAAPDTEVEAAAAGGAGAADSNTSAQATDQGAAAATQAAAPAPSAAKDEAEDAASDANGSSPAQAAAQGAAANTQAAAPAPAQPEVEDAAAAACTRFMQQAAPLIAAELMPVALNMLGGLQEAGPAWEVALAVVSADDSDDWATAAALLQDFGSTAPARLLAEVCALLPAAAVIYYDAAAAVPEAARACECREAYSAARQSWVIAEQLLTTLLQPAGGPSRVREVCGEMGLYWQGGKTDSHALSGVLQHWAEQCQQAASKLEPISSANWGPEGSFVQEWVTAEQKQRSRPVEVPLRSCCMAAHMAMELWFAEGCGPLVEKDSGSQDDAQPAVLLSHYELLKQLQDSSSDAAAPGLCAVILKASAWAARPEYRTWDPTSPQHYAWPEDGNGAPFPWYDTPSHDSVEDVGALQLLIRNGSSESLIRGSIPPMDDITAWSRIRHRLAQLQEACPRLLAATQGGLPAAKSAEQLVDGVVEALLLGKQVMSVPILCPDLGTRDLRILHSIARAEWVAAAQLVQLYVVLPRSTANAVLERFAAAVDVECLARVCALLPAAGQNYGRHSRPSDYFNGPVDYQQELVQVLAAGAATAADTPAADVTAALLRHMGFQPEAAAAAAAASSGTVGSSWERVNAALAAVRSAGGWGVGSGLLQKLWDGDCKEDREAREIGTCSVLAAAAALLDSGTGLVADAAVASSQVTGLQLSWQDWAQLAAKFVEMSLEDTPGRAAVAALLAHRVLSVQKKGQGTPPAAFRNSVLHTLSRCGPGQQAYKGAEWEYNHHVLSVLSRWSKQPLPSTDAATAKPLPLMRRAVKTAAAAGPGAGAAEGKTTAEGSHSGEDGLGVEIDWSGGGYTFKVPLQWCMGAELGGGSSTEDVGVKIEWPEPQVPSCAEIRGLGWAEGWGVAGEEEGAGSRDGGDGRSSSKKKKGKQQKPNQQKPTNQQGQGQQGSRRHVVAAANATTFPAKPANMPDVQQVKAPSRPRSRSTSSKSPNSTATARPKAHVRQPQAQIYAAAAAAKAARDDLEQLPWNIDIKRDTKAPLTAEQQAELVPTVKKLLGLPVDPSDRAGSAELVPNRLTLLLCQAMVLRGEESQAKLAAAVSYLATQQTEDSLTTMLAGCMEALFTTEDWESPTGSAQQVVSTLYVALDADCYKLLHHKLTIRGRLKELEAVNPRWWMKNNKNW